MTSSTISYLAPKFHAGPSPLIPTSISAVLAPRAAVEWAKGVPACAPALPKLHPRSRALYGSRRCTFERLGAHSAFAKMRAGDSPRRAVACSRVACRPDPPQGPARGRLGREHPVRRNPAALLRPLATGAPPHMWPPGRELWCAALSCAWCERRVTGRTLSRARRAQVQLAATRIALHTHEWRSARTRSSSPDVKRGAPCGGTAFVALRCCARGAGRRRRGHGGRCLHVLAA